ncbi:MAG: hypothetical protein RLY20_3355 [Verrucomicrobiota bacterium]|jgi:hypothetical protein
MKTFIAASLFCAPAIAVMAAQGPEPIQKPDPSKQETPVPVAVAPAAPAQANAEGSYTYSQQPVAISRTLLSPDAAKQIAEGFKAAYPKLGSPRFLIYVNRELVDEQSGMKLSGRSESTSASRGSVKSNFEPGASGDGKPVNITAGGGVVVKGDVGGGVHLGKGEGSHEHEKVNASNSYRFKDKTQLTVEEKQNVRDVERTFGRPIRSAGAKLADQRVATQLIGDKPIQNFVVPTEGEAARKDREALGKITDVVIEVLISTREVKVMAVSGDKTYSVPDIQATAIRLSDSQIIGQASSDDVTGRMPPVQLKNFTFGDVAEATALKLMEDMQKSAQ